MRAMQDWAVHFRNLRASSIALGITAFLIAGLIVFVMVKAADYPIALMVGALFFTALGLAIFVPKRFVNFVYAWIALTFAFVALVRGRFLFAISAIGTPLYYWMGIAAMLAAVLWFLYKGYKQISAPSNSALLPDASPPQLRAQVDATKREG